MIRTHHCRTHFKRDSLGLSLNKTLASYKTKLLKLKSRIIRTFTFIKCSISINSPVSHGIEDPIDIEDHIEIDGSVKRIGLPIKQLNYR